MRKMSGPAVFVLGLLTVLLVAGIAVIVVKATGLGKDDDPATIVQPTTTAPPSAATEVVLGADQVSVAGIATAVTVERARVEGITELVLPSVRTPSAGLGSGARFEDLLIGGEPATISWDAGRPLAMAGATPLRLVPGRVNVAADGAGITTGLLDGAAYSIVPGDYDIAAPVAVTRSGLGQGRDSVAFTATDASTVSFTGGAISTVPPADVSMTGPGRVVIEGTLELSRPDGSVTPVSRVELAEGSFRLRLAPAADGAGYELTEALLEGAVVAE